MRKLFGFCATCLSFPLLACDGVELRALTSFLDPIPGATITLSGFVTRNFRTDRYGSVCLPPVAAEHMLAAEATGFAKEAIKYGIPIPPSTLVVVLNVARLHGEIPNHVRGQLKGFPRSHAGEIIVVSHVLGSQRRFAKVRSDGTFELIDRFIGEYEIHLVVDKKPVACAFL